MHKFCIYSVVFSFLLISFYSCKDDEPTEIIFNGVSYNIANGLNENETALYDDRDSNIYAVVQIGDQTWMAENLRYESSGSYLNPDNPNLLYGRLYRFTTRDDNCPTGWHIPTDEEWKELETSLGINPSMTDSIGFRGTDQGDQTKSTTDWINDGNGSNSSGFNALPAGSKDRDDPLDGSEGAYIGLGESGMFWTSTEVEPGFSDYSTAREVSFESNQINRFATDPFNSFSCRCVLD